LNQTIATTGGTLTLNSAGTISAPAAVSVGTFILQGGAWSQVSASLPSFTATDFRLLSGNFLRALSGDGSAGNPYQLADVYGLQGIGTLLNDNFVLANNIDASGTSAWNSGAGFVPIGNNVTGFNASFNGQGHVIDGLTINLPSVQFVGLFGATGSFATVSNVGLTNVNVTGRGRVGALVGFEGGGGTISQSYSSGSVTGGTTSFDIGGLVGENDGTITQSYSAASVTGVGTTGGLVGDNEGTVTQSHDTGSVTGGANGSDIGGLAGVNGQSVDTASIAQSYSTGLVIAAFGAGSGDTGGLVGANFSGTITQSYSTASVTTNGLSGSNIGGLVGDNFTGSITQSYSAGSVNVGANSQNIGGLVGENDSTITQSYSTASVTAGAIGGDFGGLVGANFGTVGQSYSTGLVTGGAGSTFVGGLAGLNDGTVSADSFWDMQSSGQSSSGGGTGLTTAQFQDTAGFMAMAGALGWNFTTVWAPPSAGNYPQLYAMSAVVSVQTPNTTSIYGTAPVFTSTMFGGPGTYVFGPSGDALNQPVASAGGATTNVGTYAFSGAPSATSTDGVLYRVVYTGDLTVDPATLTYTANSASRIYGATNPAFTGSVTGFVNGQNQATATTGTLGLATSATAASNVGNYAITGSGLSANNGNYVFVQSANNATALTIDPATLIYVANPVVRPFNTPNPALSGTVTGFVNGDTLAGATSGSAIFTTPATSVSPSGNYAINGGGLFATNYVLTQAPSNATALTVLPGSFLPDILPPSTATLLSLQASETFANAQANANIQAALAGNINPAAGNCQPTPDSPCAAPLAEATFSPLLLGNDGDRAPPIQPW
jgi:hypothetical protein